MVFMKIIMNLKYNKIIEQQTEDDPLIKKYLSIGRVLFTYYCFFLFYCKYIYETYNIY